MPDDGPAFTEELAGRPLFLLIGATDLAATLATLAPTMDRKVAVVDPRPEHVGSGSFPSTLEVVRDWPDEWIARHPLTSQDAVVTLSATTRASTIAPSASRWRALQHMSPHSAAEPLTRNVYSAWPTHQGLTD